METNQLLASASGIAVGAYLFAVVWNGNTAKLGELLKGEEGYAEFILALIILGAVSKYGPEHKLFAIITIGALFAAALKFFSNVTLPTTLAQFASGRITALDAIKSLFNGSVTQ